MMILTDENFEIEIQKAEKPVLVDFYAFWCAPCSFLTPVLERIAREYEEKIIFAKVNLDAAPRIGQKYGVERIPTVLLFKEGRPLSGFVGIRPEEAIREWLDNLLKDDGVGKIIKEYEAYAEGKGFKLNPEKKTVEAVIKGLLEREKKFGFRYCPCRRVTGEAEEDKKIICPCVFHREEIEKDGHCLCRLFIKD